MVRIKHDGYQRGTPPASNQFSQIYFGDKTITAESDGLNNILGFIEMAYRSDGRTDLKMVSLRGDEGHGSDNSYDAALSVGWYNYAGEWAARATAPTPHEKSTGGEIVTVAYGTTHYLKIDGSNNLTADGLTWNKSTSSGYFTFLRRLNDPASTASTGSSQDHFVISGFNQGTLICSGETGGKLTNIQALIGAMAGIEDIALCADANLDIFTGCGNEVDPSKIHHHVFRSNGNVELGGRLFLTAGNMSNSFLMRATDLTKGTAPSSHKYFDIGFTDGNGTSTAERFGSVTCRVSSNGQTSNSICVYKNEAGSTDFAQLTIAFDPDGNPFTVAPTPPTGDRSTKIATTACFNNEGFIGYKSLTSIKSVAGCFWFDSKSGLNIDDNNLGLVQNADWVGLQIGMANGNDKTQLLFNSSSMYKRSTDQNLGEESWSDWVQMADQEWVLSQLSTSGEETHICPLNQAVVFKRSGTHICGSVHVQMYRDWDSEGQKSDTYGLYRGSTKIAEVTVTCETNVTGGSGHGRDADITLVGYFETDASIPAGSSLTLKRDVAGIDCITFRVAFAHVTVSNA